MDKPLAVDRSSTDQNSLELDFQQLDSRALADLDGTALGAVINDMQEKKNASSSKHSSHSSHTAYATYSMGPIG